MGGDEAVGRARAGGLARGNDFNNSMFSYCNSQSRCVS